MKLKSTGIIIIRSAVSTALIVILFRRIRLHEIRVIIQSSDWLLLAFATGIMFARQVVAAVRWRIILDVSGIRIPVIKLSYWYMTASFFNMFLPTVMGGDIVRIYALSKSSGDPPSSAASVLMERIMGFLALISIALIASIINPSLLENQRISYSIISLILLFFLALFLLFHGGFSRRVVQFLSRRGFTRIAENLVHGYQALRVLINHRKVLILSFFISVLFQLFGILAIYLIGRSLGLEVSPCFYFVTVPVIWLLSMIPLSINGMGVREGAFVLLFGVAGIAGAEALTMSILSFAQLIVIGLTGGFLYLFSPPGKTIKPTEQEN